MTSFGILLWRPRRDGWSVVVEERSYKQFLHGVVEAKTGRSFRVSWLKWAKIWTLCQLIKIPSASIRTWAERIRLRTEVTFQYPTNGPVPDFRSERSYSGTEIN
jgi:hypothetical protein